MATKLSIPPLLDSTAPLAHREANVALRRANRLHNEREALSPLQGAVLAALSLEDRLVDVATDDLVAMSARIAAAVTRAVRS